MIYYYLRLCLRPTLHKQNQFKDTNKTFQLYGTSAIGLASEYSSPAYFMFKVKGGIIEMGYRQFIKSDRIIHLL